MVKTANYFVVLIAIFSFGPVACDSTPETTDEDEPVEQPESRADQETDETDEPVDDTEEKTDPLAPPDDVAEPPEDAEVTGSGLAYRVLEEGDGDEHPDETDIVSVHYTGWHTDGEMFDSSVERGEPASFPLDQVIPGWTEGVQLMVEGQQNLFWIPEELAYDGQPGRPAGMLVFEVELLEIE